MSRPVFNPTIDLSHAPTIEQAIFDPDEPLYRIIIGPVGSGKTFTFIATELMRIAMMQHVFPGSETTNGMGIRRSRFAIIRNTTPELKATTIKTWTEQWQENAVGPVIYSAPITHRIRVPATRDMPGLDAEFMFLGLDKPDDIGRIKSLDVTAIAVNECSELPRSVFTYLRRRVGRFPPKRSGIEAVRPCVIADSNSTDEDHWLEEMAKDPPKGFKIYRQPPAVLEVEIRSKSDGKGREAVCTESDRRFRGMKFKLLDVTDAAGKHWVVNPKAENLANLRSGYYEDQIAGSTLPEIRRDLQAKPAFVRDGKPCVPSYDDDYHTFEDLPFLRGVPLELGIDIGGGTLNPAAVLAQRHPRGNWLIHFEVVCEDMGVENFAKALKMGVAEVNKLAGFQLQFNPGTGDPAGEKADEVYETAVFDHLKRLGFKMQPAQSNDPKFRIEAWEAVASRTIDRKPALMIATRCVRLRKALAGGWHFKRLKVAGAEMYQDKPYKNHPDSDLGDAGGYMLMGGGEVKRIQHASETQQLPAGKTHQAKIDFDVFNQ